MKLTSCTTGAKVSAAYACPTAEFGGNKHLSSHEDFGSVLIQCNCQVRDTHVDCKTRRHHCGGCRRCQQLKDPRCGLPTRLVAITGSSSRRFSHLIMCAELRGYQTLLPSTSRVRAAHRCNECTFLTFVKTRGTLQACIGQYDKQLTNYLMQYGAVWCRHRCRLTTTGSQAEASAITAQFDCCVTPGDTPLQVEYATKSQQTSS